MVTKKQKQLESNQLDVVYFYVPFVIAFSVFSLYYYLKLKKKYASEESTKRISDYGKFLEAAMYSGVAGAAIVSLIWAVHKEPVFLVISLAIGLWIATWIGKIHARVFLGVVVNYEVGQITFEYDQSQLGVIDYIKIIPYLKSISALEQINLGEIQRITREAGKHLYIHGQFGSRRISFTNKQKRDECINFIQAYPGSIATMPFEFG
jgi:hypothetical protein